MSKDEKDEEEIEGEQIDQHSIPRTRSTRKRESYLFTKGICTCISRNRTCLRYIVRHVSHIFVEIR
jgi:hypothetical protein